MRNRSTYWRAGYQIKDAKPVTVEQYCRTEAAAKTVASDAANGRAQELARLGLTNEVTVWIQRWQTWTEDRSDERVDVASYTPQPLTPERIAEAIADVADGIRNAGVKA